MAKQRKATSSVPSGLNPPGSTRPIRNEPNKRAATDVPMEVPVYVTYERHNLPGKVEGHVYSAGELAGWTVHFDVFTFDTKVDIKIYRNPRGLEVHVDGKKVYATKKQMGERKPPHTTPDLSEWLGGGEAPKPEGWATRLGKDHEIIKKIDQRKNGIEVKPTDDDDQILWEDDDEIEVDWEED